MAGANPDSSGGASDSSGGGNVLTRMLVATGGSEPSLSALRFALYLARTASSRVEALIVEDIRLPPAALFAHGDSLVRLMRQTESLAAYAWNETERRVRRIADEHGVPITIRRETGRVADLVTAAGRSASLVILGRRGCRAEHGGLLGSNTELIVRRTEKPLLLAPDEFRAPSRVVVAYGGKEMGAHALEMGVVLADTLKLPLAILTVAGDTRQGDEVQERARRLQPALSSRASFEHDGGDVAPTILRRATAETLLIMGAYGHSRLYRMALGSVTEQVMREAIGPLLLSRR
ncbi:MAG: universal stress protein [Phycisphaerales bacterium]|nr:MAG: universal stress protein [Phycisphaerales bacterium]